jgi:hypothetical protein
MRAALEHGEDAYSPPPSEFYSVVGWSNLVKAVGQIHCLRLRFAGVSSSSMFGSSKFLSWLLFLLRTA